MTLISHNRSIVVYLTVVMSGHTRYDTPFNSSPIRESHFSNLQLVSYTARLTVWAMPGPHKSCGFMEIKLLPRNAVCGCKLYATFIAHWLSALVTICRELPHTRFVCARLPEDLTCVSLNAGRLQKRISNYPCIQITLL